MVDFTGIIAILVVIGGPLAIAVVAIINEHRSKQRRYEAMIKAVEMGKNPEDVKKMFAEEKEKNGKDVNSRLRGGIILIAIALGLALMALVLNQSMVFGGHFGGFYLGASAFLLVLGLGFLLIWWISKPKTK
jgi:hypothetical protein